MATESLRDPDPPERISELLESLLASRCMLPPGLTALASARALPEPLCLLSCAIERRESIWRAWTDGTRVWFFEALLGHARHHGQPSIELIEYDEAGNVVRVLTFVATFAHGWQRNT
jgi:hypothetical protein